MDYKKEAEGIYEEILEIRRKIHENPELSEREQETSRLICSFLEANGIEYKNNIAGTGVVACVYGRLSKEGKRIRKTVAIRADMDALPLYENTDLPYKSKNLGIMHACGHDAHVAIALGCAKILKKYEDNLCGNIKFIFQPAEETIGGAKRMIEEGCLENPKVDCVIGLHVQPYLPAGTVQVKYGQLNANTSEIKMVIKGKSSHGAEPSGGVDAIVIASNIMLSLQTVVSRNVSPLNSVVLSFGKISGGSVGNIICDKVVIEGILRTLDEETKEMVVGKINEISNSIANAMGGICEINITEGYKALVNTDEIVDEIIVASTELLGKENVKLGRFPNMIGEDFSYFINDYVKGGFYYLGCGFIDREKNYPLHSDKFTLNEECIKTGIMVNLATVERLLNEE